MKTTWLTQTDIKRDWYVVDIEDIILGRAATQIAELLMGKSKVEKVPNMDCGDFVIVLNADKFTVTGRKEKDKIYYHHTGYPGGLREKPLGKMRVENPEIPIKRAVKNMLPKNKWRDQVMARLFIYTGTEHPHQAQKPKQVELNSK